jgi:transposase
LREPDLPTARLDGEERRVRLLVDHREDLVKERARIQNRLRWHLHELFPTLEIPPLGLARYRILDDLEERLAPLQGPVAEISRELVSRCRELTRRVNELHAQITAIIETLAPTLLTVAGCGVLTAAKILGETAGVSRFHSKAAFARWNGTAPVPVWSGNDDRHRLNRGGNRQVNAALHRIAITQWRGVGGLGQVYIQTRMTQGHTKTEALRLLRRRLSDVIYRSLRTDEKGSHHQTWAVA